MEIDQIPEILMLILIYSYLGVFELDFLAPQIFSCNKQNVPEHRAISPNPGSKNFCL